MSSILFLLVLMAILILLARIVMNMVNRRSAKRNLKVLFVVVSCYGLLWLAAYSMREDKIIPLGTDVCFDDWCSTVTEIEKVEVIGNSVHPKGRFYIVHIRSSNHARRISQKPSEPRVHIFDNKGRTWSYSDSGQRGLEKTIGKQPGIDHRLELRESLETQLVFDIPGDAMDLKVVIEEGPFITALLLGDDRPVFPL